MLIRPATSLDLPAIAALHISVAGELRQLAPEGFGAPLENMPDRGDVAGKFRGSLDDGDAVLLLAEEDGRLAGIGSGWQENNDDDLFEAPFFTIEYVEVHPDFRERGIATDLIAALEDYARQRGLRHVDLLVMESNATACKLYEQLGYRTLELRMGKVLT